MRSKYIDTFVRHHPCIGAVLWLLSIQYYVVQILVAQAWPWHYSLSNNLISDLGNSDCGRYSGRLVCSPQHVLMNGSFIVLGITMIAGSVLIYRAFTAYRGAAVGFGLMVIAGVGTLLVGLYPENVNIVSHTLGASLVFISGNVSLIILGLSLKLPVSLKYYTIFSGVIALCALLLTETHLYLGLGAGGIERVVAYPQSIWLIVFGFYMLCGRLVDGR